MDAQGVIAYYVMDGNKPLTAESNSNTTTYLYGLGVIGEETNIWSYSLIDGTNTQRQLTDSTGEVTYSARYTPWGDTLESAGTGNFTFGYFGGLMDEATGLMYVGEGQYYDPETGRFLTRRSDANGNPYLPFDPTGALFVPLAFLGLIYGRKKHKNKLDYVVIVVFMSLGVGLGLTACGSNEPTPVSIVVTPASATITVGPTTIVVDITPSTVSPTEILEYCAELNENGEVQNIIVFGGSFGQNKIEEPGPAVAEQILNWTTTFDGKPIAKENLIPYPGYSDTLSGKARQAEDARGKATSCNVILIGYSAGTESALMYARWRINQGQSVRAVVLLGPTFGSYNETQIPNDPSKILYFGTTPLGANNYLDENTLVYDDWADYVSFLLIHNVDILVWDDETHIEGIKNVSGFKAPSNSTGTFEYLNRNSYRHIGNGEDTTSNSSAVKNEVYDWIYSH